MNLYPLKFVPRFVAKMWGGRKLQELFSKPLPGDGLFGESWELFDFPPGATGPDAIQPGDNPNGWISATIANGPLAGRSLHDLMLSHGKDLLGESVPVETPHGPQFPLLIKFLDARDDLSVQVHPPPEYVKSHAGAFLKNEAWFVLQSDLSARLLLGAKPGVKRSSFEKALAAGNADELMNAVPVVAGETYYMPSGTLHALGGGIVAYEVQTPSDTTYRVFDFNRIDPATDKPRKLHVQQALDCIQFEWDALKRKTPRQSNNAVLASAPQWILSQAHLPAGGKYAFTHSAVPIVATVIAGLGQVEARGVSESFTAGETILLPPSGESIVQPSSNCTLLLASLPPATEANLLPHPV